MSKNEPEWLARVKATHKFHITKKAMNKKWGQRDTAKALNKSLGAINEELLVARWLRTHSSKLEEFDYLHDAVEYIRNRKHKLYLETDIE